MSGATDKGKGNEVTVPGADGRSRETFSDPAVQSAEALCRCMQLNAECRSTMPVHAIKCTEIVECAIVAIMAQGKRVGENLSVRELDRGPFRPLPN